MSQRSTASWFLLTAALLCCSTRALAEDNKVAFEAGLRAGFGMPMGKADASQELGNAVDMQLPLQLDAGVRLMKSLFLGAYFQYGFALLADANKLGCDSADLDCSGQDVRLGIQAHYHIMADRQFDPWVGLGIGYEWLTMSTEGGGVDVSATIHGFEFASLQAGLDIALSDNFRVGPFVSFSLAQYSSTSVDCSGSICGNLGASGDIPNKTLHEWLILGVRGAFGTWQR